MTDDLVKWLREEADFAYDRIESDALIEAANCIEAQAAEIERLRFEAESNYDHGYYDGCTASLEQSK